MSNYNAGERCECSDPRCPACSGRCSARATERLRRVDFAGEPECAFCAECASDAMDSGLFDPVEDDQAEDPFAGFDRESIEDACARTAFVLSWAAAEERAGRTYPGADIGDVAPAYVPRRFRAWARDVLAGAIGAIGATTRGDGIAEHWVNAKPETLGHALALSCGGWADGLGEAYLPRPIGLPIMDADVRLWVDPSEFRTDPPSADDLRALAEDRASIAERIARAISEDDPEDVLALADELLGGSGVESFELPAPDAHERAGSVRYVNRGDTYTTTLCYVEDVYGSRFVVASWGALVEQAEEERTYATGETRCAHCGDWGCEEHESE